MENHEIQTVLMNALPLQEVHVSGDGSHFQVIAVGELFAELSRVKKQHILEESGASLNKQKAPDLNRSRAMIVTL